MNAPTVKLTPFTSLAAEVASGWKLLGLSARMIVSPLSASLRSSTALVAGFVLLATTATVTARQPTVSTSLSTDSVQVAEPFTLSINVQAEQGAKVAFPELTDKLGAFEIRETQDVFDVPEANDATLRMWTRNLILESIDTGELPLPPLSLQVTQSGKTTQLTTQPMAVHVVSLLEDRIDPTKFRDLQPVVDIAIPESPKPTAIPWTAVATWSLLGLALCIGVIAYRRRQWITPHTWALRQLDNLQPDNPQVAQQLSQIVHEFLMMQFVLPDTGCPSRGRSALEIVQSLSNQNRIDAPTAERLSELLDMTDQAKFAGLCLSRDKIESAIADARSLVAALAPSPQATRTGSR